MRKESLLPMILAMSSAGSLPIGTITHGNGGQRAKVNRPEQSTVDANFHLKKARLKRQRRIERNKRLAEKAKKRCPECGQFMEPPFCIGHGIHLCEKCAVADYKQKWPYGKSVYRSPGIIDWENAS